MKKRITALTLFGLLLVLSGGCKLVESKFVTPTYLPSAISTGSVSHLTLVTPLPELIEPLPQVFSDVPVPQQAILVHQHYEGCNLCRNSGMMALYATDLSPEEVQSFYRNYLQNSAWKYDGEWVSATGDQWVVVGKWPFPEQDLQILEFTVIINQSANLSLQGMPIRQAFEKAITLGETVYDVEIAYVQDRAVKERTCPPEIGGICENDMWEIDLPADNP
jgi:hypothetical protein